MTIAVILRAKGGAVTSVDADTRVFDVVRLLAERRIGAVPVTRGGQVVGILSERDLVYRLASDGPGVIDLPASAVMTAPPITTTSDVPVLVALSLMTRRRIRHLPVVDGDSMIGFVSIGDLVKYRVDLIESEAAALRDYIAS